MTKLSLVSTNSKSSPEQGDGTVTYSEYDKQTIDAYVTKLHEGRYFKLFNGKSQLPWIISGDNPSEELPTAWLCSDFVAYCREVGRKVPKPVPSWTEFGDNLETVVGTRFTPKGEAFVRSKRSRHKYINTYRAFEPEHAPIPLSDHFHRFFECWFPDPNERHQFFQYIGHMIQHPEQRPSWHFMLLSETGTGKGFLYKAILNPLLAGQTQQVKKFSEVTGRFSNVMKGTLLVVLDDCKAQRADQQDQLKSLMTEERVLLEEKGLAAGMVTTYSRFILFTNEDVPLNLDESERRWCIPSRLKYSDGLTGDEGRKERQESVIQPLADWLKLPGALEAVHRFFAEYPLTGFNPHSPPMTETLREQIEKSVTADQAFASDFLSQHETKVLKLADMRRAFEDAGMSMPGNQAVSKLFADCGYRQDYLNVGGKSRWWFPQTMSKAEAEQILVRQLAAKEAEDAF